MWMRMVEEKERGWETDKEKALDINVFVIMTIHIL